MMTSRTARVYVLYTGGTLGMVPSDPGNPASALRPGSQAELAAYLPPDLGRRLGIEYEMFGLHDLDGHPVPPIDSSDVSSEHWRYMANAISSAYADYDGFIILHGTDTMAYTASALSFMLDNLAVPVVLTGAQLPVAHPRTDAVGNFVNALHVAGHAATGVPLIPEVVIVFAATVLRGNRARKLSSSAWQGFESPNHPPLGAIGEHIKIASEHVRPAADNQIAPFFACLDLETRIADISLFPGIRAEQLAAMLLSPDLRGAVLRTYGAGNAPSGPDLLEVIGDAVAAGSVIVNVTQCTQGMVEAGLYAASSGLLERGVISGLDLTPEAALTKLMSLLANESQPEVEAQMQRNLRGEQSASLLDVRFSSSEHVRVGRSTGNLTAETRLPGPFAREQLQQATLRIRGLRVIAPDGASPAVDVQAFLNHPRARATDAADPRRAASFATEPATATDHVADVTTVARSVIEDGRAVQLTLVAPSADGRVEFDAASLGLLTSD